MEKYGDKPDVSRKELDDALAGLLDSGTGFQQCPDAEREMEVGFMPAEPCYSPVSDTGSKEGGSSVVVLLTSIAIHSFKVV